MNSLIDVRDIRELWRDGTIEIQNLFKRNAEFWLDPNSSYYQEINQNSKMVLPL